MAENKQIKYINRDFSNLKESLINFSKTYYPGVYNDFSETSPGIMVMELVAYIGDVLSFYQDNQFQETFLQYAREAKNLYDLAYMMGYRPKTTAVATVDIDFYQQVPAKGDGSGGYIPDYDYALLIGANSQISSTTNSGVKFLVEDPVDFTVSSSLDPTTVSIYEESGGVVNYFLLKKTKKAISSTINTTTVNAGSSPQEFFTTTISGENIVGILDITDADGNIWYEVPYLGQEMIYDSIKNTNPNDPNTYTDSDVPYLLKNKRVQRRFVTRFLDATTLQLQFGAGKSTETDEEVTPNPDNIGLGLPFEKTKLTTAYSPQNFIFTNTYGIAPTGTLTVRYLTGGGASANVPAGDLSTLNNSNITFQKYSLNQTTANTIFNSVSVLNPRAASGGGDGDTVEEIRQNAISQFSTQLRSVTIDDYLVRTLSLPAKYGDISKAFIEKTKQNTSLPGGVPSTLDLYVLGLDSNGKLTTASSTLKKNLSTYLSQYRIIGDSINIKDAFIINIGVDFEIIVRPNFNNNEVLRNCLNELIEYFKLSNWQINEPILLKEIFLLLDRVSGVQTVKNVSITNKTEGNYSSYAYDIEGATINNVIYPSVDPMIFEVKFPQTDIKGRVVNL